MQEVVGRVVVSGQSAPFRALCGHYQRREAKFVVLAQERVGLGRSLAVGSGTGLQYTTGLPCMHTHTQTRGGVILHISATGRNTPRCLGPGDYCAMSAMAGEGLVA